MEFDDLESTSIDQSAADTVAQAVEELNHAATKAGHERGELYRQELAETTNRPERFGVCEKAAKQHADKARSKTNNTFLQASLAAAYSQPVTFNLGGRGVQMSLRDMHSIATNRYNYYADQARVRTGEARVNAIKRRDAFGDLLRMTDLVARGEMSVAELGEFIRDNKLGQEIVDTATTELDIKVVYTEPMEEAANNAGALADQSASQQKNAALDALFK